jgi:hypothetical protein
MKYKYKIFKIKKDSFGESTANEAGCQVRDKKLGIRNYESQTTNY